MNKFGNKLQEFMKELGYSDPSENNNYAIMWASEMGHFEVVEELLEDPRVDPTICNNHAIRWSCEKGHLEVVKKLLSDPRVDPSAMQNVAIVWASESGHYRIVEELLKDKRVDPATSDNLAIFRASRNGHIQTVKVLLKDPRVESPIYLSDQIKNSTIIELLKIPKQIRKKVIEGQLDFESYLSFNDLNFFDT